MHASENIILAKVKEQILTTCKAYLWDKKSLSSNTFKLFIDQFINNFMIELNALLSMRLDPIDDNQPFLRNEGIAESVLKQILEEAQIEVLRKIQEVNLIFQDSSFSDQDKKDNAEAIETIKAEALHFCLLSLRELVNQNNPPAPSINPNPIVPQNKREKIIKGLIAALVVGSALGISLLYSFIEMIKKEDSEVAKNFEAAAMGVGALLFYEAITHLGSKVGEFVQEKLSTCTLPFQRSSIHNPNGPTTSAPAEPQ